MRVFVDAASVDALELGRAGQVQRGEVWSVDDVQGGVAQDQQPLQRRGRAQKGDRTFLETKSPGFESPSFKKMLWVANFASPDNINA